MLNLLLTDYRLNGTAESLQAVAETLNAMAFGGIHDHLGGGMHRYSTEPTWSVPHFEKMLYDNAQLIGIYADYYAITRSAARTRHGRRSRPLPCPAHDGTGAASIPPRMPTSKARKARAICGHEAEIADALGTADADRFFALYELTPLPTEPERPGRLAHPPGSDCIRRAYWQNCRAGAIAGQAARNSRSPAAACA